MKAIRWSGEGDTYVGPFTFAWEKGLQFAVMLGSGDADDYPGARLRVRIGHLTAIVALPDWLPGRFLRPWKHWVDTSQYAWNENRLATQQGYWEVHEREYGFTTFEGSLHVHYGPQTHDSTTTKSKVWFYPWRETKLIRHSWFGQDGKHVVTMDLGRGPKSDPLKQIDLERKIRDVVPAPRFVFRDFDGEMLVATTQLEEMEWQYGTKRWSWLRHFRRNRIRRSLDLSFSGEVGRRKGSWKGGTVGHSIELRPGELHESGFHRYCIENGLEYMGADV